MGVLCHYVIDKSAGSINPAFPSGRMAKLFYEFLSRHREWKLAKRKELVAIIIVILLGISALLVPWLYPKLSIPVSFVMYILFFWSARIYIKLNERVGHLYINVNILTHHLIGKLEVGFCDHREPCQCVQNFREYVLKTYDITLDRL